MSGANLKNPSRFIPPFIVQNFLVTKVEPGSHVQRPH